jgi:lipoprotein-anchoring transpeptidase ErfK/SrfK
MTVTRNGEVLRVLPASMGTPDNPTRGGTHLVLEKYASKVLDSDTVGLPGEYETEVQSAVRLTYSGTFTHAAPWSVKDQGVRNVSHGCINLSPPTRRGSTSSPGAATSSTWSGPTSRRSSTTRVPPTGT